MEHWNILFFPDITKEQKMNSPGNKQYISFTTEILMLLYLM